VEDNEYYPAIVEEVLADGMYLVKFEGYGNVQQSTCDFIRPIPGTECKICGGPPKVDSSGNCYFCSGPLEELPVQQAAPIVSETATSVVLELDQRANDYATLKASHDALVLRVQDLERQNTALLQENARLSNSVLNAEVEVLKERLAVALENHEKAMLELETLRGASIKSRIRTKTQPRLKKPLPQRPENVVSPPPFVRQSSSTAIDTGRGSAVTPMKPK
jgi:hypothetical protein